MTKRAFFRRLCSYRFETLLEWDGLWTLWDVSGWTTWRRYVWVFDKSILLMISVSWDLFSRNRSVYFFSFLFPPKTPSKPPHESITPSHQNVHLCNFANHLFFLSNLTSALSLGRASVISPPPDDWVKAPNRSTDTECNPCCDQLVG